MGSESIRCFWLLLAGPLPPMPALGALEFSRYIIRGGSIERGWSRIHSAWEVPGIVPGSIESEPNGVGLKNDLN